jgi:hypothetical protein
MATEVVKQAAERVHQHGERETNLIRIKEVSASRGKAMRAEPISLLYEKGRVLHRRGSISPLRPKPSENTVQFSRLRADVIPEVLRQRHGFSTGRVALMPTCPQGSVRAPAANPHRQHESFCNHSHRYF